MINKIVMPKLSAIMKKGRVEEIYVKEGQEVKYGDNLLLISAEKANKDIQSPYDGFVSIKCEALSEYEVGETLLYIVSTLEELKEIDKSKGVDDSKAEIKKDEVKTSVNSKNIRALPIAKRIAKENNVDLSLIKGTGHNGMITKEDVIKFIENQDNQVETIELDPVKRAMIEHMELTKEYVKGSTFMDIDLHLVKKARSINKHSYTSYIAYAVAKALAKFPIINSTYKDGKIIINKDINLGIALDSDGKLYVPVIKKADKLGVKEIEENIKLFKDKAKNNRLSFEDLSDGTFSITNSGVFGSLFFSPIINYPQSAIMGLGKIADSVVVYDNAITIRPIMIVSLSYDHRIIEGSKAVKFLATVKKILEDPSTFKL